MRFLVDQCLSPRLASSLNDAGHDAIHTADLGFQAADDSVILGAAQADERVVITADSDFGTLLASTHATSPSVLYVRRSSGRRVEATLRIIMANLPALDEALVNGSIVVLGEGSLRVRPLPIL